ncbi:MULTISPECIES: hypothetical protein [Burkholderiaceae]|uniref:Uncharacterized protein n=1 Tax=Caballeronia sordidicola TaxID=196367 RepID=A0A242MYP9_CABSO|nr:MULTISPECIES: hypothetical protein [Burkholderiaceae]OTP76254.1 hypothetical protein PAMC26577_11260 [Caballeronia sordidicola]
MSNGKLRIGICALLIFVSILPSVAFAHVKWFCSSADASISPVAPGVVLTPAFALYLGIFSGLLFVGTWIDSWFDRRWPALACTYHVTRSLEEKLMRVAVGAFFLCLWDKGAVVPWSQGGEAILTPELVSGAPWISMVQFSIAAALVWRRTCVLAALGIIIVYGAGIADYGFFHLVDYVFFIGIAGYLALTSFELSGATRWRVPILCGSLSISLMWTAIEKFVYPQWTISVLTAHPSITVGVAAPVVTVIAGFVEFTPAFFLSTGCGLLRAGAGILLAIFAIAIPEFGHLDAVGDLSIIAILAVAGLHGVSPLQQRLRPARGASLPMDVSATVGIYLSLMVCFFGVYYGLHRLQFA